MNIARELTRISWSWRAAVFFLLTLMVMIPGAQAELGNYCLDANTTFYNWTIDGVVHNTSQPCIWGCEDGTCLSDTSSGDFALIFVFGFLALAGLMAYLAMNVDREKHGHIQILFIFMALFSGMSAVTGMQVISDLQNIPFLDNIIQPVIIVYPWIIWFILGYLLLIFIGNMLEALKDAVENRKAKKRGGLSPLKA